MSKKAIFFDLDGTLWNAINEIKDCWNITMQSINKPYRFDYETIKSTMGLTPEETAKLLFKDLPLDEGLKLFKLCFQEQLKYLSKKPGELYPNEIAVLESLSHKYPLYILSNSDKGYIDNYVNGYKLRYLFKGYLCAGDTGLDKGQNIVYLKNKENIDDVIYVGDTKKDLIESNKANVKFIHAQYGFGIIENDKHFIKSLNELPKIISILFKE
jgi:haloacid dehalogenase superfamily, subfamily IA, variant 1 with third motif having Dx(3-4)D or Dx(3-4)E